jgi:hypothetical protein
MKLHCSSIQTVVHMRHVGDGACLVPHSFKQRGVVSIGRVPVRSRESSHPPPYLVNVYATLHYRVVEQGTGRCFNLSRRLRKCRGSALVSWVLDISVLRTPVLMIRKTAHFYLQYKATSLYVRRKFETLPEYRSSKY